MGYPLQAPPALAIKTANTKPEPNPPASNTITPATPNNKPTTMGIAIASNEGNNILRCPLFVDISTQRA